MLNQISYKATCISWLFVCEVDKETNWPQIYLLDQRKLNWKLAAIWDYKKMQHLQIGNATSENLMPSELSIKSSAA